MGFQPRPFGAAAAAPQPVSTEAEHFPEYVGLFGDSRMAIGHYIGGSNVLYKAFGVPHWLQAYSRGRLSIPPSLNKGVSGDTTKQMLDRIDDAVSAFKAAGVKLVVFIGGTNDLSNPSTSLERVQENILRIIRRLHSERFKVVAISESPRGGAYDMGQAQSAKLVALNRWYDDVLSKMGVPVANVFKEMVNPATGYTARPGVTYDELHQSAVGAEIYGRNIWGKVKHHFPLEGLIVRDGTPWNRSTNPYGSMISNGMFKSTTGGNFNASARAVPGSTLPSDFLADGGNTTGLSTTWTLSPDPDGYGNQLTIGITGTAIEGAQILLVQGFDKSRFVVGDVMRATALVDHQGSGLNAVLLDFLMVNTDAQGAVRYNSLADGDPYSLNTPYPEQLIKGLSRQTPDLAFATNQTSIMPRFIVGLKAGPVDVKVTIRRFGAFMVKALA